MLLCSYCVIAVRSVVWPRQRHVQRFVGFLKSSLNNMMNIVRGPSFKSRENILPEETKKKKKKKFKEKLVVDD